jgi:hypothetical protein
MKELAGLGAASSMACILGMIIQQFASGPVSRVCLICGASLPIRSLLSHAYEQVLVWPVANGSRASKERRLERLSQLPVHRNRSGQNSTMLVNYGVHVLCFEGR